MIPEESIAPRPAASLTLDDMRSYLSRVLSSVNTNKINGILAEIDFRAYVSELGFGNRVSEGGWIVRSDARGDFRFGQNTIVFFPETIQPNTIYAPDRELPEPRLGLHTICATFHQIGIRSYFCAATILRSKPPRVNWQAIELGRPDIQNYEQFPDCISGFNKRSRPYNFEKYKTDASVLPSAAIPVQYSKEAAHIAFRTMFLAEVSDVDGLL
ncbi:hypothetical protein ES703_108279 [subsurface metagenome]